MTARTRSIESVAIVTVLPEVQKTDTGRILRIPIEAGYGKGEFHMEGGPGSAKLAQKA